VGRLQFEARRLRFGPDVGFHHSQHMLLAFEGMTVAIWKVAEFVRIQQSRR